MNRAYLETLTGSCGTNPGKNRYIQVDMSQQEKNRSLVGENHAEGQPNGVAPKPANSQDPLATQQIPEVVQPPAKAPDGNGSKDLSKKGIRPVTVRLGEGFVKDLAGGDLAALKHPTAPLNGGNGNS